MPTSDPEVTAHPDRPDVLVIEARTAAAALEEVHARLGAAAEIITAERVTRGGVAGFFAREHVQLHARPTTSTSTPEPAMTPPQPSASAPAPETTLDGLLADLAAQTASEERSFAEVLRGRLPEPGGQVAGACAAATPVVVDLAVPAPAASLPLAAAQVMVAPPPGAEDAGSAAPGLSAPVVGWSATNLLRLGLPPAVVDGVQRLDPRDDTAWVSALARVIGTLTRPLPGTAAVYVGMEAGRLAEGLSVEVVAAGALAPADRAFAVAAGADPQTQSWLAWSRRRRWLHVVVGGEGWRPFLFDEPLAVSWVGDEHLCEAVRLSAELGLVLGYGLGSGADAQVRRATPLEVALAIRDLLPQR